MNIWGFPAKKSEKLPKFSPFRPAGTNSLPDVDEIRKVYAGNRSIKAINIWCDSVKPRSHSHYCVTTAHEWATINRRPLVGTSREYKAPKLISLRMSTIIVRRHHAFFAVWKPISNGFTTMCYDILRSGTIYYRYTAVVPRIRYECRRRTTIT